MIKLRPSNAHRWLNCPGSIHLERDFGQKYEFIGIKDRERGIAMHKYAEKLLSNAAFSNEGLSDADEVYVENAVAWVREITGECGASFVEKKLKCSGDDWEITGTADVLAFDSKTGTMHVFDYKFGFNPIKPDCLQLRVYALMSLNCGYDVKTICTHIVQPTKYSQLQTHTYPTESMSLLREHIDFISQSYATRASDWCKYCTFATQCNELKNEVAKGENKLSLSQDVVTNENASTDLIDLYALEKLVNARKISLEAHLTASIERGEIVQGFMLKSTRGSLGWTESASTIIREADLRGMDVEKPATVITPTQTLTKYKKNEGGKAFVEVFSQRKAGTRKLTGFTKADIKAEFEENKY